MSLAAPKILVREEQFRRGGGGQTKGPAEGVERASTNLSSDHVVASRSLATALSPPAAAARRSAFIFSSALRACKPTARQAQASRATRASAEAAGKSFPLEFRLFFAVVGREMNNRKRKRSLTNARKSLPSCALVGVAGDLPCSSGLPAGPAAAAAAAAAAIPAAVPAAADAGDAGADDHPCASNPCGTQKMGQKSFRRGTWRSRERFGRAKKRVIQRA